MSKINDDQTLILELEKYPGGVALWGGLPAVFDTTNLGYDSGIHVHARLSDSPKKVIDKTFTLVEVVWKDYSCRIDEKSAVSFTMSSIFDIEMVDLQCNNCSHHHLDSGYNAIVPHQEHCCHVCHDISYTDSPVISNPLITLKQKIGDGLIKRSAIQPDRVIHLDRGHYQGGFQIWGSNPSIIWTANRLEESAIHVHALSADGRRVIDNTYSDVYIMNDKLDIEMIRVLQIQQTLLKLPLATVRCPECLAEQFDTGISAVKPTSERYCGACHYLFKSAYVVSNPMVNLFKKHGVMI